MALALTIVIGMVVVVLALVGYVRDLRRSLLALLGTLVGAILVSFWGDQWGAAIAGRFVNGDVQRVTFYVNCAVFLWSTLVVGYGGGILLSRAKERPLPQRLTSALLGLVDGVLIVGFLLRFATAKQPNLAPLIQADPVAKIIHDGLPLLFLGVALIVTAMVISRVAFGLFRRGASKAAQPTQTKSTTATTSGATSTTTAASTADKRIADPEVLKKVADASAKR